MELFRLLGTIAIDNTEANNALNETSQRANDSANETESAFAKIGGAAKTIALGIGAAGLAIGGAFIGAVEGTREYRAEMGLLEAAFLTAGHSSKAAKDTYSELNAVLGDSGQAVEASQHLAKIADNEKELAGLTNILTGVYATFGESLPLEGLAEGINHSASLGEVQGSLADALEWSGITVEAFNEQLAGLATEEERQDLIVKTLNDTYSAASVQYQETNADIMASRQAQERLADAMARVGAVGEPILTAIKNAIASMAESAVPKIESLIAKFRDGITWIKKNQTTVKAWIAVIMGATTAIGAFILIISWSKIMTKAANALKVVRTAMLAMNAAMMANPIGLVVALIAGLVVAFLYLWNNVKPFRQFWIDLWNKMKSATSGAVKWISGKFNDLKGALNGAKSKFSEVQKTISDKMQSAQNAVKKAIDKIKGFFKFKWSLPKLKMPSIGIKGKFGIDPPSVPKFSIKWNAEGGILDNPTIFGKIGNTFLGGGEAGAEAIAPIDVLQDYVRQATTENNALILEALTVRLNRIIELLESLTGTKIYLDSGVLVGELAEPINKKLGVIYNRNIRGNTH